MLFYVTYIHFFYLPDYTKIPQMNNVLFCIKTKVLYLTLSKPRFVNVLYVLYQRSVSGINFPVMLQEQYFSFYLSRLAQCLVLSARGFKVSVKRFMS